jgi:hypothetical protein
MESNYEAYNKPLRDNAAKGADGQNGYFENTSKNRNLRKRERGHNKEYGNIVDRTQLNDLLKSEKMKKYDHVNPSMNV